MTAYERLLRPLLFRLGGGDAEVAHHRTLRALASAGHVPALAVLTRRLYAVRAPRVVFGLTFPNPVGLAAGLDKNGQSLLAWPALGLGFVEIGTVTPEAQDGNPAPRVFRLPASQAVINRLGFPNVGARALAHRLAQVGGVGVPLGINLGKARATPLEHAAQDYVSSLRVLYEYGDYFVVNVSSPNTPGLRSMQQPGQLSDLLGSLCAVRGDLAGGGSPKPLLVKIAPDLTEREISNILDTCRDHEVAGVVATNTTLERWGLAPADRPRAGEAGGLSGRPLAERTRAVVAFVHRETGGQLPVIGVGGVLDADDALRLFDAGASLVQVCTGLIYRGPRLVKEINRALGPRAYT